VCGNPGLGPEKDREYGRRIVLTALKALQLSVKEPTLFDPADMLAKEGAAAG
jgi:hypothetical protein